MRICTLLNVNLENESIYVLKGKNNFTKGMVMDGTTVFCCEL
jgi:hypothetical protein